MLADEVYVRAKITKAAGELRLAKAEAARGAVDKTDVASGDAALAAMQIARAMIPAAEAA